ncbi:MAG: nitroreductase family protein [Thermoguttaceae bacterium]
MDALQAIRTRRSIRKYQDKAVPEQMVRELLEAAMLAPSARNAQPWQFVVITDRGVLAKVPKVNPNAWMAKDAPLAILVCGDTTLELSAGYWPVDCAAATENILLAAHALGLGAVWTGIYPRQKRMDGFRGLLGLPEHVIAHSLVVIGYPAERPAQPDRFRADRVHYNGW